MRGNINELLFINLSCICPSRLETNLNKAKYSVYEKLSSIFSKLKQILKHLTEYIQIYKNNDPLLLNLVNKYVLSDLLKLEMVLDFRIS